MDLTLAKKYAELKQQAKEIELQLAELAPQIMSQMKLEEETTDFGKFAIINKKAWLYSDEITHLAEQLKAGKKEEEQKGIASFTETPYLQFKPN